jgi:hypothetical protein
MKTVTGFIIFFTCMAHSQKKQCFISYNQIDKIFNLQSHEDIDSELKKLNYTFNFSSSYITYWNEKEKSNFNIFRDENSKIIAVYLDINENYYNSLKKEIVTAGFIKIDERLSNYRLNYYYKKNDKYLILAKVNTFDIDGVVTKTGFEFGIYNEDKFNESINELKKI